MEPFKPFPVELQGSLDDTSAIEDHRNLFCFHYEDCLTVAVRQDWRGWTCSRCPLVTMNAHKPDPLDFATARHSE